jgi:hypothetical protein
MSMQVFGGPINVTGTAQNLTAGLGISRAFFKELAIRADTANTGRVWLGKAGVTGAGNATGFLDPGDAVGIAPADGFISTDELYFVAG